jgi:peptidoglycan biosynthesis protein MviN/MurJ (putative lipid II flippase)
LAQSSLTTGFFSIVFANIISKVISIAVTWKIVSLLLSDQFTDEYFFLSNSVILFAGLLNNLDTIYVMPHAASLHAEEGASQENDFLLMFFYLYFFLGLFFFGAVVLLNQFYPVIANQSIEIGDIVACGLLFVSMMIFNYFNTICYYKRKFGFSSMFIIFVQLITLLFLYFFSSQISVSKIILFQAGAYLLSIVLLVLVNSEELRFVNQIFNRKVSISRFHLKNMLKLQVGFLAAFFQNYTIILLLTGLGLGYISSYNYSNQILSIPGQFFLTYFSIIIGVKLNEISFTNQKNTQDEISSSLNTIVHNLIVVSAIATVAISLFLSSNAYPILNLFFSKSGVEQSALLNAASMLEILVLYLPAAVNNIIYSRILHIKKEVNYSSFVQILFNALIILFAFILSFYFGFKGVALGITLGYVIHVYFILPFLINYKISVIKVIKTNYHSFLYLLVSVFIFISFDQLLNVKMEIFELAINGIFTLVYMLLSLFLAIRFGFLDIDTLFPFVVNSKIYQRIFK